MVMQKDLQPCVERAATPYQEHLRGTPIVMERTSFVERQRNSDILNSFKLNRNEYTDKSNSNSHLI